VMQNLTQKWKYKERFISKKKLQSVFIVFIK
jgi:hypothetical protein